MFEAAITEFRELLGEAHTLTDAAAMQRYGWCTIPILRQIAAVLRPASVEEVQQVVRTAARHQVPLYPISTGNNWGYGSAQPARDHNVVVDLGRMNRILQVNTDLAYAVLEPGVTQRQLYQYLQDRRIPLWLNPTGAGPHCSILGNTLERGFGIGPSGNHFLTQYGKEVVLAIGEIPLVLPDGVPVFEDGLRVFLIRHVAITFIEVRSLGGFWIHDQRARIIRYPTAKFLRIPTSRHTDGSCAAT